MNKFNQNFPNYDDDSDYNTNANSYYKDLGRKTKLIKLLAKRIWEYENTLNETLEQIEQRLTDYIDENDSLLTERLENWDKRIEGLDEEVSHIFVEWLNDGTLEQIINHDVLGNKADKTYVDELNEHVTTKMARTDKEISRRTSWGNRKKPTVVFTFDDGYVEDLTVMKPLFDEFGFKATTYIISGEIGGQIRHYDLMTLDQIQELANGGWEIGSHTVNHLDLSTLSNDEAEFEMVESKKQLEKLGFTVTNFAYPFGGRSDFANYIAHNNYHTATAFYPEEITIPIRHEQIPRISMGSFFYAPDEQFPITDTFDDYYKYWVDNAIEKNGLTVFALHSGPMLEETGQVEELRKLLQYCYDNDVDVLTLDEALDNFGNKIYTKTYNENYLRTNSFIVDANNHQHSHEGKTIRQISSENITTNTPPDDYPKNTISITAIIWEPGSTQNFPEPNGKLYTIKMYQWNDDVRQMFFSRWGSNVYVRHSKQDNTWSKWMNLGSRDEKIGFRPLSEPQILEAGKTATFKVPDFQPRVEDTIVGSCQTNPGWEYDYLFWNDGGSTRLVIKNNSDKEITLSPNQLVFNIRAI